jgi:hypothetical protein
MSLGYDCSPAAALRNLNIRDEALPFDWVQSNLQSIINCIEDNFDKYHKNLYFNSFGTRLIDSYGFQFPHDYPFNNNDDNIDKSKLGEGIFGEELGKQIINKWGDYHLLVLEKYKRRIERFYTYLNSETPLIFLCRGYALNNVNQYGSYLTNKFKKNNIYFVISSNEKFKSNNIITCDTEKNGIWNESSIWLEAINEIKTMNNL